LLLVGVDQFIKLLRYGQDEEIAVCCTNTVIYNGTQSSEAMATKRP
jgi:hypothetical protein